MSARTFSPTALLYTGGWTSLNRETPSCAAFSATDRPYSQSAVWIEMKISASRVGARIASSSELAPRSERRRRWSPRDKDSALLDLARALVDHAPDHQADRERGGYQDRGDDRPLQRGGAELVAPASPLVVGPRQRVADHRAHELHVHVHPVAFPVFVRGAPFGGQYAR